MSGIGSIAKNEKVASYTEIREAADVLVNYLNSASLTESMLATTGLASLVTSTRIEDGSVTELLLGNTEPIPDFSAVEATLLNFEGSGINFVQTKLSDFLEVDPTVAGREKQLSLFYHAAQSKVDYSSVLSDVAAIFCNLVPPVQMSLCTPYLDVKILYPKSGDSVGALNPLRFVGIPSDDKRYEDASALSSIGGSLEPKKLGFDVAGMEIFCMPQTLAASNSDLNGIDALTLRGVNVLNPISPLLTIESVNIQQTGINGSLYAQTKIDLSLVLHDRSRLSDIEPLVSVGVFPTLNMRITYGWSHPDTNKMTGNPFAKFINSMRFTQLFAVYSVSISSRDMNALSIKMSLVSSGSLTAKSAKLATAAGKVVPYTMLQTLVKQYVTIKTNYAKKSSDSKDTTIKYDPIPGVGTTISATASGGTNLNKFVKITDFYTFYDTLQKIIDGINPDTAKVTDIISALNTAPPLSDEEATNLSAGIFDFIQKGDTDTTKRYGYKLKPFKNLAGGFIPTGLESVVKKIAIESGYTNGATRRDAVVPLASAVGKLVAAPLLLTLPDVDEVRIHCFSFNSVCGEMAKENIGNFPIVLSLIQDRPEVDSKGAQTGKTIAGLSAKSSCESALQAILAQVNNPASPFYGFSDIKKKTDEAVKAIREEYKNKTATTLPDDEKERIAKEAQVRIDELATRERDDIEELNRAILQRKAMLDGVDPAFVPPRIKSQIEVLDSYDSQKKPKKILRIVLYDERSGGFNKLANLVFAMANSGGIARVAGVLPGEISKFVQKLDDPDKPADLVSSTFAFKSVKDYREIAQKIYPNIIVGSDAGSIISANYSSQPGGDASSAYLLTAVGGDTAGSATSDSAAENAAAEVLIIPSTISLNMIGNVCISRGQTYYVDFGTGTSLDQAYTVTSVSHSIRPGTFTTSVSLIPTNNATVKSTARQLDELKKIISNTT